MAGVLFTIETNNACGYTHLCEGCVLNEREKLIGKRKVMSDRMISEASREALSSGDVCDFVYAGKEPLSYQSRNCIL